MSSSIHLPKENRKTGREVTVPSVQESSRQQCKSTQAAWKYVGTAKVKALPASIKGSIGCRRLQLFADGGECFSEMVELQHSEQKLKIITEIDEETRKPLPTPPTAGHTPSAGAAGHGARSTYIQFTWWGKGNNALSGLHEICCENLPHEKSCYCHTTWTRHWIKKTNSWCYNGGWSGSAQKKKNHTQQSTGAISTGEINWLSLGMNLHFTETTAQWSTVNQRPLKTNLFNQLISGTRQWVIRIHPSHIQMSVCVWVYRQISRLSETLESSVSRCKHDCPDAPQTQLNYIKTVNGIRGCLYSRIVLFISVSIDTVYGWIYALGKFCRF